MGQFFPLHAQERFRVNCLQLNSARAEETRITNVGIVVLNLSKWRADVRTIEAQMSVFFHCDSPLAGARGCGGRGRAQLYAAKARPAAG
jgi:hypothetical protein